MTGKQGRAIVKEHELGEAGLGVNLSSAYTSWERTLGKSLHL